MDLDPFTVIYVSYPLPSFIARSERINEHPVSEDLMRLGSQAEHLNHPNDVQLFSLDPLVPMSTSSFKLSLSRVSLHAPPPRIGDNVLSAKFAITNHYNLCVVQCVDENS